MFEEKMLNDGYHTQKDRLLLKQGHNRGKNNMKNFSKAVITLAIILGMSTAGVALADNTATGSAVQGQQQGISSSPTGNVGYGAALAKQEQGQGQSQNVSGSNNGGSGGSVSGSGNATFKNSFNGAKPIRYLPVPTHVNVSTQGGPQIFGSPDYADRGPHFMSMLTLVTAMNMVDLSEVSANDAGDIEMVAQLINVVSGDEAPTADAKVEFFLNKDADVTKTIPGFKIVSVATLKADDSNSMNSASLAVKLAEYANEVQATKVVFVSEGTSKRLSSWGVGIGISYNYASVGSKGSDTGAVGAGGTGWSYGQAEYKSLPYLTAILGN